MKSVPFRFVAAEPNSQLCSPSVQYAVVFRQEPDPCVQGRPRVCLMHHPCDPNFLLSATTDFRVSAFPIGVREFQIQLQYAIYDFRLSLPARLLSLAPLLPVLHLRRLALRNVWRLPFWNRLPFSMQ